MFAENAPVFVLEVCLLALKGAALNKFNFCVWALNDLFRKFVKPRTNCSGEGEVLEIDVLTSSYNF